MTDPLGTIRSYDDLQAVCRAVAEQRQMSRTEIDRLAGFAPGLAAKLLADPPLRHMGRDTFPGMLGALGLKLAAVDDPEALARFTKRAEKRNESQVRTMHGATVHIKIGARKLKRNQRLGGKNSRKYVGKKMARKLAKRAARARWRGIRPIDRAADTLPKALPRTQALATPLLCAGTAVLTAPAPQRSPCPTA